MTKFVVAGAVRDVSKTIHIDIERLKKTISPLGSVHFVLIESNSSDNSAEILMQISKMDSDVNFICLGKSETGLTRTEKLAEARNTYLNYVQTNPELADAEYLVVSDFNNLNSELTHEAFKQSIELNAWDVCTANQSTKYYDVWALRHEQWSPNDCWEALNFYRKKGVRPGAALLAAVHSRMVHIPKSEPIIEVDSAFGGLAIYKMQIIGNTRYRGKNLKGLPICEHVPFHQELKSKGHKIIVNPYLINAGWVDHTNQTRMLWKLKRISNYPAKWIQHKFNL